jgi:hypothetical protein
MPIPAALDPSVSHLFDDRFDMHGCNAGGGTSSPICTWGDRSADRTMVVVGDSHAQMWLSGLIRFSRDQHYRLIPLVKDGCSPSVLNRGGPCTGWYHWVVGEVGKLHPSLVVLSQYWSGWGPQGLSTELHDLRPLAPQMALIEDPPARPVDAVDCLLTTDATRQTCTFPITSREQATYASVKQEAATANVRYVPTLQWICAYGACPGVVGNVVTFRDKHHLTETYARLLAQPLAAKMAGVVSS